MTERESLTAARSCVTFVRNFAQRIDIPEIAKTESLRIADEADAALNDAVHVHDHLIEQRDNWRNQAEVTQQALADVKEIWKAWDASRKGGAAFVSMEALERIGDVIDAW